MISEYIRMNMGKKYQNEAISWNEISCGDSLLGEEDEKTTPVGLALSPWADKCCEGTRGTSSGSKCSRGPDPNGANMCFDSADFESAKEFVVDEDKNEKLSCGVVAEYMLTVVASALEKWDLRWGEVPCDRKWVNDDGTEAEHTFGDVLGHYGAQCCPRTGHRCGKGITPLNDNMCVDVTQFNANAQWTTDAERGESMSCSVLNEYYRHLIGRKGGKKLSWTNGEISCEDTFLDEEGRETVHTVGDGVRQRGEMCCGSLNATRCPIPAHGLTPGRDNMCVNATHFNKTAFFWTEESEKMTCEVANEYYRGIISRKYNRTAKHPMSWEHDIECHEALSEDHPATTVKLGLSHVGPICCGSLQAARCAPKHDEPTMCTHHSDFFGGKIVDAKSGEKVSCQGISEYYRAHFAQKLKNPALTWDDLKCEERFMGEGGKETVHNVGQGLLSVGPKCCRENKYRCAPKPPSVDDENICKHATDFNATKEVVVDKESGGTMTCHAMAEWARSSMGAKLGKSDISWGGIKCDEQFVDDKGEDIGAVSGRVVGMGVYCCENGGESRCSKGEKPAPVPLNPARGNMCKSQEHYRHDKKVLLGDPEHEVWISYVVRINMLYTTVLERNSWAGWSG